MSRQNENPRFVLGLKVRNLRQAKGYSLQRLSDASGLSVSYLSEIEKGKKYPKPEKLIQLAGALSVPYDELVSLQLDKALDGLRSFLGSDLLREFPLDLFGLETKDFFALVSDEPKKASALVRTIEEIGRMYDVQVEHFLFAALRSYQQVHANYFEDLERAAAAFREKRGWSPGRRLTPKLLAGVLAEHDYKVDESRLVEDEALSGFRSVFAAGPSPTLYLNPLLLDEQKAFILAREIGYRELDLPSRAITSSWLEVESFDQLLSNFKASYFAGALLIDGDRLSRDLSRLLRQSRWQPDLLRDAVERYGATPEMLFYRLTELAPKRFGLDQIFFLRFHNRPGDDRYELTKTFNLSSVPVPHGIGLSEHYCRRWPAMRLLAELARRQRGHRRLEVPLVTAQRSRFLGEDAEFFVLSMARPLVLTPGVNSAVSLGFLVDDHFRDTVRFLDDPKIREVEVDLTCERCPLSDCAERAATPDLLDRQREQEEKRIALARLLAG